MKTRDEVLANITTLPMLPDIVLKVIRLSNDPRASVDAIVETLRVDQGITANVLRLCNSSYYSLSRPIESINDAVVYLGSKTITDLMMAGFCSEFFSRPVDAYKLDHGDLWRHAVAVATASQAVAQKAKKEEGRATGLEYTSGLLHDIGKIILSQTCSEEFALIVSRVEEEHCAFEDVEREILGFSHSEIGAEIARRWRMPERIIEAIEFHHHPEKAEKDPWLVACVHVANILAITMGLGIGLDGLAVEFHRDALEILHLEMTDIMELTIIVHEQYAKAMDSLQTA